MRKGGGKQKGASFEREISVALSLWVSGGKDKDLFWRSAMSGGRATVAYRKGDTLKRQTGDITANAPEGHALTDLFFVEVKFYKDLEVDSLVYTGKGKLAEFWKIACTEAAKYGKRPMLIAKANNRKTLLCMNRGNALAMPGVSIRAMAYVYGSQSPIHIMLLDEALAKPFPFGGK
jgi:hypothetical protein